ncbi:MULTISPECIES: glycine zipper 2TM domain-containing protein [Henriciella]|jgi:outer membrane lipoprotein SlyB|uniref:17 kDa surface antigen n=1 Tax=Henriciella pelagia TaxID=1977912 RepID=A0ABQ1JN20_9PROT|nr:glycine zipper 2TM domain-containing protein [Henriciella pelagia]GGB73214.1 hypothetical protein GCM10011503_22360 [Henriciella pelagia]
MTTENNTVQTPSKMMAGAFAALTLALAGCASGYGANTVSPNAVGYQTEVRSGVVTTYREVQIKPEQSWLGAATGAVLGGLAGSELGGGDKAQTAGAVGGAVLGGVAGNEAGKALNTRRGYAYTVRFDNGQVAEIIQGGDIFIQPGTRVNVTYGDRVRVVPLSAY